MLVSATQQCKSAIIIQYLPSFLSLPPLPPMEQAHIYGLNMLNRVFGKWTLPPEATYHFLSLILLSNLFHSHRFIYLFNKYLNSDFISGIELGKKFTLKHNIHSASMPWATLKSFQCSVHANLFFHSFTYSFRKGLLLTLSS